MTSYYLVGEYISFPADIAELNLFIHDNVENVVTLPLPFPDYQQLSACATTWMDGEVRELETWQTPLGVLLKTSGCSDFYLLPSGVSIVRAYVEGGQNQVEATQPLTVLDRAALLGPALILSLAMRFVWSLHASAARLNGKTIAFLGESGYGKSTLAAYLGRSGWSRVADDILPATGNASGILAWPHFPQLKLPPEEQPALDLPESLPLDMICLVSPAPADEMPQIEPLTKTDAVTALLSHTAGTRLFWPELLSKHLAFCAQAGGQLPVYRLTYPHRRDALPLVREMLEALC